MSIKFLLDENVDDLYRTGLLRQFPDAVIWRVGSPAAPPLNTLDPDILDWCEQHRFVLVTKNRASMPVHLRDHLDAGKHILGIIVLNPNLSIADTMDELALILEASKPDEYADQIRYLPFKG